jgi:hypothetical protein
VISVVKSRVVTTFLVMGAVLWAANPANAQKVVVDAVPSHVANTFIPTQALGAGIDRIPAAAAEKYFGQPALPAVLAAGWQPVTYRQNTELAVEAWHWNPQGTWSDPSGKGYFTGSATPPKPSSIPTVIRCLTAVSRAMRVPRPTVFRA